MPNSAGELWIVAGCNGAGKSTFINRVTAPGGTLEGAPTPNLDRHTGELLRKAGYNDPQTIPVKVYWHFFKQADNTLQREIRQHLTGGRIACVETVLSTDKYLDLVAFAGNLKAPFRFVYVTLKSPELAKTRVAQRVLSGGHPVLEAKVVERYYRSLDNLPTFAALADEFWVYDNSDSSSESVEPPRFVCGGKGKVYEIDALCPVELAARILSSVPMVER